MVVNSYDISITTFCYFFLNWGYLKVAMYCFVGNIPGCIYQGSQRFRLEALKYFNVGITCYSPQLDSVGPDKFYYDLTERNFLTDLSRLWEIDEIAHFTHFRGGSIMRATLPKLYPQLIAYTHVEMVYVVSDSSSYRLQMSLLGYC